MGRSLPAGAVRLVAVAFVATCVSCSRPDPKYYPLTQGLSWEYDIYSETRRPKQPTISGRSRLRVTNLEPRHIGVWETTPQRMELGSVTVLRFFAEAHDGVGLVAEQGPGQAEPKPSDPPDMMLPYPIKLGQKWESNSKTEVIDRGTLIHTTETVDSIAETVTVPAGTFRSCVRVKSSGTVRKESPDLPGGAEVTLETTAWYAANVGAVQVRYKETSNRPGLGQSEVTYQLVSMSNPLPF